MKQPPTAAGFSLVEVALALGIAAFCLISVFGLLPVGLNTNSTTLEQANAASAAESILADLRATALTNPPQDQSSPYYQLTIPAAPAASPGTMRTLFLRADGTPASSTTGPFQGQSIDLTQNPHYRATIYFTSTSSPSQLASVPSKTALAARVLITWPAVADVIPSIPPANFVGSLEAMTTLLRN
jgi:uncharacterized protein (TIGR02598 family)